MSRQLFAPVRVNPILAHPQERRMSLGGAWRFRLDPEDRGSRERWFGDAGMFREEIEVPGCWQGQGFGGDGKDMIWDFRLRARTFRATYTGTGWYARTFRTPDDWDGMRVWMNFGGVHPSAEVWLNGAKLGENHEPFVPFGFEVGDLLKAGEENALVVRVHEASRIMGLAYSWQGNWSGLYRSVELTATRESFLERFWATPEVDGERLRIRARIGGTISSDGRATLRVSAQAIGRDESPLRTEVRLSGPEVDFALPIPSPSLWSPDAPNLYRVDAELVLDGQVSDALSERTGFVALSTAGKHFLINGEPYYMRGTGEFLPYPETGSPDTDRERWRKKLATLRAYGYNYVRCQSYVPAPEYFDVADEVGLLVQSEMGALGAWGSHTEQHIYAWPQPTPGYRHALKRQWDHVVIRDANHPSANLYCMSNELGTQTNFPRTAWQCYHDTKAIKPTAFVIWTDGGYNAELPGDFVNAEANVDEKCEKPLIQHEFRWWSSLPDVGIMHKYSGAVRPYAAEMALAAAARHGISHVLPQGAQDSQRLQFAEAKGKMEMCRRDNPRMAGICHFNAMDTNPSPQGIIDEFYERKYADAATWRETNGDAVLLSGLGFDNRILTPGETLACDLFVSDFSHPPFKKPVIDWRLVAGETSLAAGRIRPSHQPFCTYNAGNLKAAVPDVATPAKARLEARLSEGDRLIANRWDLWLFPAQVALPGSLAIYGTPQHTWVKTLKGAKPVPSGQPISARQRVVLTERLDETLVAFARSGGRMVLAASEGLVRPFNPKFGHKLGHYFFTPPANYPPYEDGHDGTIILDHRMLGGFPHEGFADLQFFRMISDSPPLELESLGLDEGDPVIRVLHSYSVCHPLGYLIERRLGKGGLILTALNLDQSLPEARYLLAAICAYAVSGDFAPPIEANDSSLAAIRAACSLP